MQPAGDERLEYERALRELRRDIGCTWERLSDSGPLFEALQGRLASRGGRTTIDACIDELRDLITELSDPVQREPLLVALRLHPDYQDRTLTSRRRHYNSDLRASRSDVDTRTLERRENRAIRTLTARLVAGRGSDRPGNREDPSLQNRHFHIEHRETWYKIGPQRVLREQLISLRVVALVAEASILNKHFSYRTDQRDGVLEIEPMFGCELDGDKTFRDGITFQRLCTPRPLAAGEIHNLVIRVSVHSDQACYPRLMTSPGLDQPSMVKHIDFTPDSMPERVWRFAHLTNADALHNPRQTPIPDGPHQLVSQYWHDLRVGLCYGFAWEW